MLSLSSSATECSSFLRKSLLCRFPVARLVRSQLVPRPHGPKSRPVTALCRPSRAHCAFPYLAQARNSMSLSSTDRCNRFFETHAAQSPPAEVASTPTGSESYMNEGSFQKRGTALRPAKTEDVRLSDRGAEAKVLVKSRQRPKLAKGVREHDSTGCKHNYSLGKL